MAAVSIDALHRSEGLRLQRFLLRVLGNPADAADAAQETSLRLLKALATTDIEHPRVFLFHIARNVAATLGQRRRFEAGLFRSLTDEDLAAIADPWARGEQGLIARRQLRLVAAAIDALPRAAARRSCSARSTVSRTARSPPGSASAATWSRSTSRRPCYTPAAPAAIFSDPRRQAFAPSPVFREEDGRGGWHERARGSRGVGRRRGRPDLRGGRRLGGPARLPRRD